jgi:hypothetical protein
MSLGCADFSLPNIRSNLLRNLLALAAIALALSAVDSQSAQAGPLDVVLAVPRAIVNDGVARVVPIVDLSTTIPSGDDVRAFPRVREGRVIGYPVRVLRYGLNIYPTSRIVRQNGGPSL